MKKTIILILASVMAFSVSAAAADSVVSSGLTEVKTVKKTKGEIKEVTFNAHLHCGSCVKKVQENISFEKGVKDLKVSLADQKITIKYDSSKTSEQTLKAAIEKLGVKVSKN